MKQIKWTVMIMYPDPTEMQTYIAVVKAANVEEAFRKTVRKCVLANGGEKDGLYTEEDFAFVTAVPGEQELYRPGVILEAHPTLSLYDVKVAKLMETITKEVRMTA